MEQCPKLKSLTGLDKSNFGLETVYLLNCKNLKKISELSSLQNLRELGITQVSELESFDFLPKLSNIKNLYINPIGVGVKNDDYYPLVEKLKNIGKLDQINKWKRLDEYLSKKVHLKEIAREELSELQSIKKNLSIKHWNEKYQDGLEQYTPQNCKKAETIFSNLLDSLETNKNLPELKKIELIKLSIIQFNELNNSLGGCFIESGEREEICDIYDNIADVIGIDSMRYEDGIASEWREW